MTLATSMTGFGRGEGKSEGYSFVVEARTVNNRYLDMNIKMPRKILFLEDWVRQQAKQYVQRGRLEIFVKMDSDGVSDCEVSLDMNLAQNYYDVLMEIRKAFDVKDDMSVVNIARFPDVVKSSEAEVDTEEITKGLGIALEQAMTQLCLMRDKEGEQLRLDILQRTETLEKHMDQVNRLAVSIEAEYRQKIKTKMDEILKTYSMEADEQRIVQEAAIYADKSSIAEEIVRFQTHIKQLRETMDGQDSVGRKLDFLIQEMNREVNTIGSKSSDIEVTSLVVELKSEMEKIREQVQNME